MDDGAIIESGTHAKLMANKGLYYRLYTLKNLENEVERNSRDIENLTREVETGSHVFVFL